MSMNFINTRTIDELGRIILPIGIINKLGISVDDTVDIVYDDVNNHVVLLATKFR